MRLLTFRTFAFHSGQGFGKFGFRLGGLFVLHIKSQINSRTKDVN